MNFHAAFDGVICMDAMEHIYPEDYPGILHAFCKKGYKTLAPEWPNGSHPFQTGPLLRCMLIYLAHDRDYTELALE
jgi:hypothetical protein